jgi:membrane-bound metal-dependent hydrolase YbcI (DUF457 family)
LGVALVATSATAFLKNSIKYCNDRAVCMPSPVAHMLGGLASAFVVDSFARRPSMTVPVVIASAAMAIAPDFDLLGPTHRTYSHSIGAVVAVGFVCWVIIRARAANTAIAAVLTAAYASHLPLDWLSKDTREPSGITALWPFSAKFYQSPFDVFPEISRRYWLLDEFIFNNLRAAAWEFAIVGPFLLLAWAFWSKRTLNTNNENRKTNSAA